MVIALDRAAFDRPLPTLPVVVVRLLAVYAAEDYAVGDVVRVLETDPALSGRIMRLANSAYYGFRSRIDTVAHAAVLLGEATVQAVALGSSLLRTWRGRPLPPAVEDVWLHSYLAGFGCRELALRLPPGTLPADPDAIFLAGLLHDVGKILFLSQDEAGYAADLTEAGSSAELRGRELRRFGTDHAEAGAELLGAWHLPPWLCAVVGSHHEGELRSEFEPVREVLAAAHAACRGEPAAGTRLVPAALADDLLDRLAEARPEAEAFYRAIS